MTHAPPQPPLASDLERDRLEHRARRLDRVARELRARAEAKRAHHGHVPAPLGSALAGFQSELRSVRSRLGRRGE